VHTNLLPVLVVLSLGVMPPVFGQPESILPLEHPAHGDSPFHKGDLLDIQGDLALFPVVTRITVLDTAHWPWVLAKSAQGETWLNFDHVVIVKNVAAVK